MTSFAKAQLLKYGWTEGKGLGKNENGIVDPLKPKLKFDTTGVGHNDKEHKWWESVYNKAASNVNVDTSSKEVSVSVKDKDAVEISTRKLDPRKLKKNNNLEYGSFLKTCTLDNGKVVPEENLAALKLDEVVHEALSFELTDEQLFQACGGRTAHKGARHGLTLSGKLARIAQQEAEMFASTSHSVSEEWTEVKKKKKLKRKRRRSATEMDLENSMPDSSPQMDANANNLVVTESASPLSQTPEERKKSKIARRKEKRCVQDLVHQLNSVLIVDESPESEKKTVEKKKKKKKRQERQERPETKKINDMTEQCKTRKCKDFKRKFHEDEQEHHSDCKKVKSSVEDCGVIFLPDGKFITFGEEKQPPRSKKFQKWFSEADRLNHRIEMKKKKRQAKSEKNRVERLSECLMAVNLCEDSVDSGRGEDLIESCETSKKLKKWKKHKKEKKDKKIEVITLEP